MCSAHLTKPFSLARKLNPWETDDAFESSVKNPLMPERTQWRIRDGTGS